jgi:hypothetical protein
MKRYILGKGFGESMAKFIERQMEKEARMQQHHFDYVRPTMPHFLFRDGKCGVLIDEHIDGDSQTKDEEDHHKRPSILDLRLYDAHLMRRVCALAVTLHFKYKQDENHK